MDPHPFAARFGVLKRVLILVAIAGVFWKLIGSTGDRSKLAHLI